MRSSDAIDFDKLDKNEIGVYEILVSDLGGLRTPTTYFPRADPMLTRPREKPISTSIRAFLLGVRFGAF
jgi:hypothetical protein